jgi:hypothetical protein
MCAKLFLFMTILSCMALSLYLFRVQLTQDKETKDEVNNSDMEIVGSYGILAIIFFSIGTFLCMLFVCLECKDRQGDRSRVL